jgi:hypothetical protein
MNSQCFASVIYEQLLFLTWHKDTFSLTQKQHFLISQLRITYII